MIRSLLVILAVALLFGFIARIGMGILNQKMGLDESAPEQADDAPDDLVDYSVPDVSDYQPVEMTESGSAVWNPDWKATPCSLFISAQEEILVDSLPQAPGPADRPTELQLLMELWADRSGYSRSELDRVWAFSSGDTCFIDLPISPDWLSVQRTIEARFVSYTRLFPYVAGEPVGQYDGGIALRGIPSSR